MQIKIERQRGYEYTIIHKNDRTPLPGSWVDGETFEVADDLAAFAIIVSHSIEPVINGGTRTKIVGGINGKPE